LEWTEKLQNKQISVGQFLCVDKLMFWLIPKRIERKVKSLLNKHIFWFKLNPLIFVGWDVLRVFQALSFREGLDERQTPGNDYPLVN